MAGLVCSSKTYYDIMSGLYDLRIVEQIQARVGQFHNIRNQIHNELIFKKHANQSTNLMSSDAMSAFQMLLRG